MTNFFCILKSLHKGLFLCFSHVKLIFLNGGGSLEKIVMKLWCLYMLKYFSGCLCKVRYSLTWRNYNYQNLEMDIVNIYINIVNIYHLITPAILYGWCNYGSFILIFSHFSRRVYCSRRKAQDHIIAFSCCVSLVSFNPEQHQSLGFMALKLWNSIC